MVQPEFHAAILLAIATGIVASGIVGSTWELLSEDPLEFALLKKEDLLVPIRVLVLVFAAPWMLICWSVWWFIAAPPWGFPVLAAALAWSFVEGVFVLTQIFGLS